MLSLHDGSRCVLRDRPGIFGWIDSRIPLALAALYLTGCESFLMSSEYTYLWALSPALVLLFLGGAYVWRSRHQQLKYWDLVEEPSEPNISPILMRLAIFAFLLWVAFGVYNWYLRAQLEPRQIALNLGAWLIGSILGSALAFLVGLRLAEPRKLT